MHTTIEAVYDNGEFYLEEVPNIKKARVFITFIQEIKDDVKGKVKFPTKKLGKIMNIEREGFYGDYLSDRY
ncbi:MAG: hypothetical protein KAW12_24850 [Candidatus Aminicenantes bacterium]|nr:hypothetical protein [Candidatus Aminicenantes bacterium]